MGIHVILHPTSAYWCLVWIDSALEARRKKVRAKALEAGCVDATVSKSIDLATSIEELDEIVSAHRLKVKGIQVRLR